MKINYSSNISWQNIGDKIYIINQLDKQEYILDDVSKDIWSIIGDGYTYDYLINKLSCDYNENKETIDNDVQNLIMDLRYKGLICIEED